jgi:hypothetical protein
VWYENQNVCIYVANGPNAATKWNPVTVFEISLQGIFTNWTSANEIYLHQVYLTTSSGAHAILYSANEVSRNSPGGNEEKHAIKSVGLDGLRVQN